VRPKVENPKNLTPSNLIITKTKQNPAKSDTNETENADQIRISNDSQLIAKCRSIKKPLPGLFLLET
jgi:hypothetical protein